MGYIIALVLCCGLEFVFVPMFLKAQWPTATKKSLLLKMICASLFVAVGVLSMYAANNFSTYAYMMLCGLIFGWLGDFFLHVKSSSVTFGIGFTSFLIGHIVYITSYIKTLSAMFPEYRQINIIEIAVVVGVVLFAAVISKKIDVNMPGWFTKISMYSYLVILLVMLVKATALGINTVAYGVSNGVWALLTLFLGSLCFTLSDISLGVIMFGGRKKNYPLKKFNLITYFIAQVLLALSILFING